MLRAMWSACCGSPTEVVRRQTHVILNRTPDTSAARSATNLGISHPADCIRGMSTSNGHES
jgi:hypothetical protein